MLNKPIVSVVVPVYNAEQFLSECIESVLRQSYRNIQLVLIDDSSTDDSGRICQQYTKQDNRIHYIRQGNNGGVCKARNTGINKANGKYICFMDADDFIEEDYIERYVSLMEQKQVPVIYGQLKYYQDGKYLSRPRRINEGMYKTEEVSAMLIDDGTVTGILFGSVCGAIYDLDYIRTNGLLFDEKIKRNEDGLFNLDLLAMCENFYVIHYDGYCYRQWKDTRSYPKFEIDKELDMATEAIRQRHSHLKEFKLQMQRRNVSVIFWNAIKLGECQERNIENCCALISYLDNSSLDEDYATIRKPVVGIYKRILLFLLYKRHIYLFCWLMRYIYPVMKRFR